MPLLEIKITRWLDPHTTGYSTDPAVPAIFGMPLRDLVGLAYGVPPSRVRGVPDNQNTLFGFKIVGENARHYQSPLLRASLGAAIGFRAEERIELINAIVIQSGEMPPKLGQPDGPPSSVRVGKAELTARCATMSQLARALESRFGTVVLDESGVAGSFAASVHLAEESEWGSEGSIRQLNDQLGLRFVRVQRPVKFVDVIWNAGQ